MSSFHYRALQSNGAVADGVLEAANRQEALRAIEGRGLRPIRVAEANGSNGISKSTQKNPTTVETNPGVTPSLTKALIRRIQFDLASSVGKLHSVAVESVDCGCSFESGVGNFDARSLHPCGKS